MLLWLVGWLVVFIIFFLLFYQMASLLTKVSTNIIPLAYIIVTLFIKTAVDDDTRAIFCESIANPGGYITDLVAIAAICDRVGLPLIVDNTTATPYLCNPIKFDTRRRLYSTCMSR